MAHEGILSQIGLETEVTYQGRTFKLSRLELQHWDEFVKWARTILPDPLAVAELHVAHLDKKQYDAQMKLADPGTTEADKGFLRHQIKTYSDLQQFYCRASLDKATSYLGLESAEMRSVMGSIRGMVKLHHLMLTKYQPDATENDAYNVVLSMSPGEAELNIDRASGQAPPAQGKNAEAPADAA